MPAHQPASCDVPLDAGTAYARTLCKVIYPLPAHLEAFIRQASVHSRTTYRLYVLAWATAYLLGGGEEAMGRLEHAYQRARKREPCIPVSHDGTARPSSAKLHTRVRKPGYQQGTLNFDTPLEE